MLTGKIMSLRQTMIKFLWLDNRMLQLYLLYFIISLCMFLYYAYYNPLYYITGSDLHYYLSVADSVFRGQGFQDITTDPASPIITPQNGVVFLHLALMSLGIINPEPRFLFLMAINYMALIASLLLIYRIFRFFKIAPSIIALFLGVVLFSNIIFKALIQPINDGLFFFLSLLLIYLVLSNHSEKQITKALMILITSIVITHFRNQGLLILFCASLTYAILKDYKWMVFYFISCCISFLSVQLFYMVFLHDFTGINEIFQSFVNNFNLYSSLCITFCYMLPQLFLGITQFESLWFMFPFSILLFLYLLLFSFRALQERDFAKIFLVSYVFGTLVFNLLIAQAFRYLVPIFPFLILFLAINYQGSMIFSKVLLLYVVAVFCLSMLKVAYFDVYYLQNKYSSRTLLPSLPNESILLSSSARYSYFYTGKRASTGYSNLLKTRDILIFGDQHFIDGEISKIEKQVSLRGVSIYEAFWRIDRASGDFKLAHLRL